MKSRTALNIAAIVLAAIAGISVYVYASSADRRAADALSPRAVVVTKQIVPAGTTLGVALDQGWISETMIPAASLPSGALDDINTSNRGLLLLQDVPAGQIVFTANLATKLPQVGPLTIPDGLMAVTVELSDPARLAPFLRAGAEVAVFDTAQVSAGSSSASIPSTRIVLERALVLGVGQTTVTQAAESQEGEGSVSVALVTLAVTQSQAEVLVHAVQTGAIYFALLRDGTTVSSPRTITDSYVYGQR